MASWPDLTDLEDQLQSTGLTGQKAMAAQTALDAATHWVATRCGLYQRDIDGVLLVDVSGEKILATSIPAAVRQAILLYAAKFYMRKDSPNGIAGSPENGLIRTGRYDSDAEQLLEFYVTGPGIA